MDEHLGYSTPFTDGWTAMTILPQLVIALNAKTHTIKESVKFRKGLDITDVPVFVFVTEPELGPNLTS